MTSATGAAISVRDMEPRDHDWVAALLERDLGGRRQARLGELLDPLQHPGLVAERDGQPIGVATLIEGSDAFEILTLNAIERGGGAGSVLLETVVRVAAASEHARVWLVTTNDNLEALRFYLSRGMHVAHVHSGAVAADRELKPAIPLTNPENGLPIRDLIELEIAAESTDQVLPHVAVPAVVDLDRLPAEAMAFVLQPLVEGASRFLARLADHRPFETDEELIGAMRDLSRELTEEEQIELIEAHPRIGAPAESVSQLSRAEQGYDVESAEDAELARAYEELAWMNELYEQRFGFRYVTFVAGRPKTAIPALLEVALRNDREAELRRAVDDAVDIAADRLHTLRNASNGG
jgi:2-oxo-4-hydroxy-4-carboxy--5-ureidoimidazoline (OHCU) decarboxylase/N-acetylglutamate synthase-like GNAT family acetyltransferase